MRRLDGATLAIREAIVEVSDFETDWPAAAARRYRQLADIDQDDDLIDDVGLVEIEIEGLFLIIDEVFGVKVPEDLFRTPLYRTPVSLAEWVIRQAEVASYAERWRA